MPKMYVPYIKETWSAFKFKHPIFQLIGLRGIIAGHTETEEKLLKKYAKGCKNVVEIGIAEGASAGELRPVIDQNATLYLIDPFLSGRIPYLSFTKMVAHRYVGISNNASVCWIEDFSYNAVKTWNKTIDFLFIDGDHSYEACLRDWTEWSPFIVKGGIVAFHDGRIFAGGWTTENTGSVMVVNDLFRNQYNPDWQIVDEADSVVVVKRIN